MTSGTDTPMTTASGIELADNVGRSSATINLMFGREKRGERGEKKGGRKEAERRREEEEERGETED